MLQESSFIDTYPRVLIVNGDRIATAGAMGITLNNLFAGWPSDRLVQIFTSALPSPRRSDFEYRLRPLERRGLSLLRAGNIASREARPAGICASTNTPGERPKPISDFLRSELRNWLDLLPYQLPGDVEKALVDFRPNLVYACLGKIQISNLALHCAKLCNVPIVPHFMDDWMSTEYADRPDMVIQRRVLLRTAHKVLDSAPFGIAISDLMAEEYSATYGIPFHSFVNCAHVPERAEPEAPFDREGGPRLIYVGRLHLGRWRPLKDIGDALASLNREGTAGKLYVYAPKFDIAKYGQRLMGPGIEVAGSITPDQVAGVLAGGQVLVHVESFEPTIRRYTRLSLSTKIPQYAAIGRPIFCYGPGEVASLRFVEKYECGLVVGSRERSELISALRTIIVDGEMRHRFGVKAHETALLMFDEVNVRERFRNTLSGAASITH